MTKTTTPTTTTAGKSYAPPLGFRFGAVAAGVKEAGGARLDVALIVSDRGHRDHIAFIRPTGQNTAINRFDSLSISDAGVETAGKIHGHVLAAEGEPVGVNKFTAGKNRQSRRSGAHIDGCRP